MNLKEHFIQWYANDFAPNATLYQNMTEIAENSPWHHEDSIAIHTDMVVSNYLGMTPTEWKKEHCLGAFAAAFHDVGKPTAMEIRHSQERGEYKRFTGHELISAREWENWAVINFEYLRNHFSFLPIDIFKVGFMIENHLPWGLKKVDKLNNLAFTVLKYDMDRVFLDVLMSDTKGRISTDWETKVAISQNWCEEFSNRCQGLINHSVFFKNEGPILYVLIGASGSGKSTFRETLSDVESFSLDDMRLELYGEPYDNAFFKSTKDKHFRATCNAQFIDLTRKQANIVLDNTNVSAKSRRFYITEARKRGYQIRGVLFPISLQTIIKRQQTRSDKSVPIDAVTSQYYRLSYPKIGEVDDIEVVFNSP